MVSQRKEVVMKEDTRLALLEQSISWINQTMMRMENRFDQLDKRLDKIDSRLDRIEVKIDSNFKWLLGFYIGGFSALFGLIGHGLHWV